MTFSPWDILEKALGINKPAAIFLGGGVLLLTLAIGFGNQLQDTGLSIVEIAMALLAFSVVVLVLAQIPGRAVTVLAWLFTVIFCLWLICLFVQVLRQSAPPLPTVTCLIRFWNPDCAGGTVSATVETAELPTVPAAAVPPVQPADARAGARVFIQFAGYTRDDIRALAEFLVDQGWAVEAPDDGGERIATAADYREVRFFFPEDAELAKALADAVTSAPAANERLVVKDLSRSSVARRVAPGHLEIWTHP